MKKIAVSIILAGTVSLVLLGQGKPDWLDEDFRRMKYPENVYITGFAYGAAVAGKPLQDVVQQMKIDAQADLSQKIRVQITSRTQTETSAVSANGQYRERESFNSQSTAESAAELIGVKTESYYDAANRLVYAFAYANRYELTGYHKGVIAMNLAQAEGLLRTAQELETAKEKVKARQQCETAKPLLDLVRSTQMLLKAIDAGITPDDLQQAKTETLQNWLTQMQTRLAQAVIVYMESSESNLSKPSTLLANKLKSTLSEKGCSFTNDPAQADLRMKIEASTRYHSNYDEFVICVADITVNLFDVNKDKSVFQDEFTQKGVYRQQEEAGKKALEDAAPTIIEKISQWIE